jgi:phage terminase small subunit
MNELKELSEKAQEMFKYYCDTSVRTPGQRALLLQALRAMDAATQAAEIINREGLAVTSARSGLTRAHPLLKIQREAAAEMLKIFKVLGLERPDYASKDDWVPSYYPDSNTHKPGRR